jgi:hypothetical protein
MEEASTARFSGISCPFASLLTLICSDIIRVNNFFDLKIQIIIELNEKRKRGIVDEPGIGRPQRISG